MLLCAAYPTGNSAFFGTNLLDDLIYNFLLQSEFPRASILLNAEQLAVHYKDAGDSLEAPSFVIVDPDTAKPLAVIDVVDAVDQELLAEKAKKTRRFAQRVATGGIPSFIIRVDMRGSTQAEQVQFYKIISNTELQSLSSKTFPDLDTLRVARMLADANQPTDDFVESDFENISSRRSQTTISTKTRPASSWRIYIPALLLLLLVLVDSYFTASRGVALLSLTQSVLVIGAALLFTLPALLRSLR